MRYLNLKLVNCWDLKSKASKSLMSDANERRFKECKYWGNALDSSDVFRQRILKPPIYLVVLFF